MPIRLDSLPVPDPHDVTLPDSVTVSLVLHSTGNANTMATIAYSIDPTNNVFFSSAGGPTKLITAGPFVVPVPPGVVNDDSLPLVRGAGTPVVLVPIGLEVQEVDAAGLPLGTPQHRNVMVQIN